MQLPWDEHFLNIVTPAWQAYRTAEDRLSAAIAAGNEPAITRAKYDALREGGSAAFYVHHFAEIVKRAQPHWLPDDTDSLGGIRAHIGGFCTMLRSDNLVNDVALLKDVAEALKHAILDHNPHLRHVEANDAVIVVASGFGRLGFGEESTAVSIRLLSRHVVAPGALCSVLQNVVDAWRRAAGIELPALGQP